MRKKFRSFAAFLLGFCMIVAQSGSVRAEERKPESQSAAETVSEKEDEAASQKLATQSFKGYFEKEFDGEPDFDPDEPVTMIVEVEQDSVLSGSLQNEDDAEKVISELQQGSGAADQARIRAQAAQDEVKARVEAVSEDVSSDNSESYTLLVNAFTIEAPYGKMEEIRRTAGVKRVAVAGTFSIPDFTEGITLYTDSSSKLIGASEAQEQGYTGKGTMIGILDTGIEYTHEAFANRPEGELHYTQEGLNALIESSGKSFNAKHVDTVGWENVYSTLQKGDGWYSEKIAFSYDYGDKDQDATADNSAHGVHVAGIAAGKTVDSEGNVTFSGVAPDAQIAAMKVFDQSGDCSVADMLLALEDCLLLDVDVINMSLGSASGFSEDVSGILTDVMDNLEKAGIVVAVASGNDGTSAANNPNKEVKLPSVYNPDFGMLASPASYAASFAVASMNNAKAHKNYILLDDLRKIFYSDSGEGNMAFTALNGTYEVAVIPGYGEYHDYHQKDENGNCIIDPDSMWGGCLSLDMTDKIALVQRGGISSTTGEPVTFSEKISQAYGSGAKAVIVYDNEGSSELLTMQLDYQGLPAIFISKADGEAIISSVKEGKGFLKTGKYSDISEYDGAGEMSSFSSWGPGGTLTIKPEVTAPGGNIYSSVTGGGYGSYSGTSMACPQIAGAAAVLKQYIGEIFPEAENPSLLIRSLMMSTADPVQAADSEWNAPVRQQGAGLINLADAISSGAVLYGQGGNLPKAELGSSESGSYGFSFLIDNFSDKAAGYKTDVNVQSEKNSIINGMAYFSTDPQDITSGSQVAVDINGIYQTGDADLDGDVDSGDARFIRRHASGKEILTVDTALAAADANGDGNIGNEDADKILEELAGIREPAELKDGFVVPAGSSAQVSVEITLTSSQANALKSEFGAGTFIEGWVSLASIAGGEDLTLPYLGYLGDWDGRTMFDTTYYDGKEAAVLDGWLDIIQGPYSPWGQNEIFTLGYNYFAKDFHADKMYLNPDIFNNEYGSYTAFSPKLALLRNANNVTFNAVDAKGDCIYSYDAGPVTKSYYYAAGNAFLLPEDLTYMLGYPADPSTGEMQIPEWPEDGEPVYYQVKAVPEGSDQEFTYTYPAMNLDRVAPEAEYKLEYNEETGDYDLKLEMQDENYIQGVRFSAVATDGWNTAVIGSMMGAVYDDAEKGAKITDSVALSDVIQAMQAAEFESGQLDISRLIVEVVDYAWNVTTLDISFDEVKYITEEKDDGTVSITGFFGMVSHLEIPDMIEGKTVTEIGEKAFAGQYMNSVVIPDTVTAVGAGAFQGTPMNGVSIPEGVSVIGEKAFGYDADGNKIQGFTMTVYPGSVGETYALENGFAVIYASADGLVYSVGEESVAVTGYTGTAPEITIPNEFAGKPVTAIQSNAFYQNETIKKVTLPETMESIGSRAFMYAGLEEIKLPDSVQDIGVGAFAATQLKSIAIPEGITEIKFLTFQGSAITKIDLPSSVISIGDDSFSYCANLQTIDLTNITSIGQCAFQYCSSLSSVVWPGALKEIPFGTFEMSGLKHMDVPEGVTQIAVSAFRGSALESISLPSTLELINPEAFNECISLKTVVFAEGEGGADLVVDGFLNCSSLQSIVIPGRCKSIAEFSFYGCTSLNSITLKEGIESIGRQSFEGCNATSVSIPQSVVSIDEYAFGFSNNRWIKDFTLYGYAGSAAEEYVNTHNQRAVERGELNYKGEPAKEDVLTFVANGN